MINYADKGKNPSFATSKSVRNFFFLLLASRRVGGRVCSLVHPSQVLNILQMHYPERSGASLILNVPFLIHAFYKMISPLIDPVTRNKMKFNPKPVEDGLFAADELFKDSGWGGSREFVWDHEKYWGSFVRMCDERREAQMARWRKLGARVGCDEWDYKSEAARVGGDTTMAEKTPAPQDQNQDVTVDVDEGAAAVPEGGDMAEQTPACQAQDQGQGRSPAATDDVVASGGSSENQSPPEAESKSEVVESATAI
jgi:CRAL/TRIO domain